MLADRRRPEQPAQESEPAVLTRARWHIALMAAPAAVAE
jgi:hypothetical protein